MKPVVIPVRNVNGQLLLLSPGLDDAQVRELFAGARLRANRDGLFAEAADPVSPGTRTADDCFCPECGARGFVLPCPSCCQP